MTAAQMGALNAEILRNLGIIAEDESMLARIAKYLRNMVKSKQDPTLFTKEEFFSRIDEAKKQAEEGKVTTFDNLDDMNAWLNSL